jgi:2-polyprenyl-6-methoxyphenol hydroxylase-like FAD-dependent oxidoreductase
MGQVIVKNEGLHACVIGAGITGPAAAITLAKNGYDVEVYEARTRDDMRSDGVLGITEANWSRLVAGGVNFEDRELDNYYTIENTGETMRSEFHYIVWTGLHAALVEKAESLGVEFHYGQKLNDSNAAYADSELVVVATGVGSAKEVTRGNYTGYVVIRGLAYQFTGTSWTTVMGESESGPWLFNVGDTKDGASVELFVARQQAQMKTTYSPVTPPEAKDLPIRWSRLLETVPLWQTAALSDWEVPEHLITDRGRPLVMRLGDANGQMRPQTSMGANLGLNEAATLPVHPDFGYENMLLHDRQEQYHRGIALGIQKSKRQA